MSVLRSPVGTRPSPGASLLFLREEELRLAQDLLFFAYRDFTNAADVILEERGLGRAHHRALHFIGRNPAINVSDLLGILRITKQSLARVLSTLVYQGLVSQSPGSVDRRQRLLALTKAGEELERKLFDAQRKRLGAAYREAGGTRGGGIPARHACHHGRSGTRLSRSVGVAPFGRMNAIPTFWWWTTTSGCARCCRAIWQRTASG